jgi:hypothetical protein
VAHWGYAFISDFCLGWLKMKSEDDIRDGRY